MTGIPPYAVLIVEDHQVVAEGLAVLLGEHPDLRVVGWSGSVGEVERIVGAAATQPGQETPPGQETQPPRGSQPPPSNQASRTIGVAQPIDVVIADYWLPDGTGVDAVELLRRRWPDLAVVFLSADDSDEVMLAALEAGAAGYLVKSAGGADVAAAVRQAAEGEILVPARQLAALLARRREQARRQGERSRRLSSLTPRERQILGLMAEGMDNREVATRLGVSYTTVRSHVRHVLGKLGARSKLEAVVKAADLGLPERQR